MRSRTSFLAFGLVLALLLGLLTGCQKTPGDPTGDVPGAETDYAASIRLDMNSNTRKQNVTVKTYVDGDTTHFIVPESVMEGGVFKARYLAVNTPESTGKIEEYGKAAARFTHDKLSTAAAILIESDDAVWNADSTGGRYLVWVWYKPTEQSEWRNLNVELLQNGLAIASSSANNRYGTVCTSAINQAKALKLNLYSGEKDPDFYYGDAKEITLRELRLHTDKYSGMKVAFEGVITKDNNSSVYVEEYDPDSDLYYGMAVYYGYNLSAEGLEILTVGNRVRIVGTVQYYEAGGSWQVSGLTYRMMRPDDPSNIQKISSGHEPAFREISARDLSSGSVTVAEESGSVTMPYGQAILNTSVSLKGLTVKSIYTTNNAESSSNGAMTLTCEKDGVTVTVRTIVLYDEAGKLVTADAFRGAVIDVKGLIDVFDGAYQIKVFSVRDITVK